MQNCWELNKCGKEDKCRAGTATELNGMNGGKNGGRVCFAIPEDLLCCTEGGGKVAKCLKCSFRKQLKKEGVDTSVVEVLNALNNNK